MQFGAFQLQFTSLHYDDIYNCMQYTSGLLFLEPSSINSFGCKKKVITEYLHIPRSWFGNASTLIQQRKNLLVNLHLHMYHLAICIPDFNVK